LQWRFPSCHRARANRGALFAVAGIALASGILIWFLPWQRWRRASTLALLPPTFVLIAVYNLAAGNDGFRYAPFFFITFGWIGLVHPRGTSAKALPSRRPRTCSRSRLRDSGRGSMPGRSSTCCRSGVLLGEATAWVSDRLGRTQLSLREQEAGFRKLFLENPQRCGCSISTTTASSR